MGMYFYATLSTQNSKKKTVKTIVVRLFFSWSWDLAVGHLNHWIHPFIFFLLLYDFVLLLSQRILIRSPFQKLSFIYHSQTQFPISESIDNESVCSHRKHTANEMNKTLLFIVFLAKWNISFPVFGHSIFLQLLLLSAAAQ